MILIYWVKFSNHDRPEKWNCKHMDDFWHRLREHMLRNPSAGLLEWIIRD